MDFYQRPSRDYRDTYKRGRFYIAPFHHMKKELAIVRPLNDQNLTSSDFLSADVHLVGDKTINPFSHEPFKKLKLKSDEEFCLIKVKKRPVILVKEPDQGEFDKALVVPVFSIKGYHKNKIPNFNSLKKNEIDKFLYLPPSIEYNAKESVAFLFECSPQFMGNLEPVPRELTQEAMRLLDEKITFMFDLFNFEDDSSAIPE